VQVVKTLIAFIIAAIILGFGPGMTGQEICPECGRIRSYDTIAYGHWVLRSINPQDTDWTAWYEDQKPIFHEHHWVQYGPLRPSLFAWITFPFPQGDVWDMPDNLVDRMRELTPMFRLNKVMEIPKVLNSVNDSTEWRAIVVPLSLGTPQEAFKWWESNQAELEKWASQPLRTPLSDDFKRSSEQYIKDKSPQDIGLGSLM
jgi:hypothetical protein